MLAVGRDLAEPFGAIVLENAAGCARKQASNAITRWLLNGFIKRVDAGKYRRLAKFPGGKEVGLDVNRPPSSRPPPQGAGEVVPAAVAKETPALAGTTVKLTPYSEEGVKLGKGLKSEFTPDTLAALLPGGKPAAYYWVAQWRARNWIEKRDFDVYRKTATFGE